MPADYTVKAGDTQPPFVQILSYENGSIVDLAGATVGMTVRSLATTSALTLTGTVTSPNPAGGYIQYTPTAHDTATPGNYMAEWNVTFPDGTGQTFPTDGYLWIEIQPSLVAEQQQLVGLPEVKQWLRIDAAQRDYDDELLMLIEAVRPLIEADTGPILPQIYDEWYDGGSTFVSLRHRPSFGYGTNPLLTIIAASEYIGPIEWPLALVASPDLGQLYSVMLNPQSGTLTRRTAGGGIQGFQAGRDQVHVVYQAGQNTIPHNVRGAVREVVREYFRTTAATGRGFEALADQGTGSLSAGWLYDRYGRGMLEPTRRHPAVA